MITGAFGTTIDLTTGKSRRWIMGKDQIKRWADTNEPVPLPCPICGSPMVFMYGCHWDYDRWVCTQPINPESRVKRLCPGEIELTTTTYIDES